MIHARTKHVTRTEVRRQTKGFTTVELAIGIAVAAILTVALAGFIVALVQQLSVGSKRNAMATDIQTALSRIEEDVFTSTGAQLENVASDPNAPSEIGKWQSGADQLVLAHVPRNSAGTNLYTGSSDTPDSIVYYLNGDALYRRVVASSGYAGNRYTTATCSGTTAVGGCSHDVKILDGVVDITFSYLTNTGVAASSPAVASLIRTTIQTTATQAGQTIPMKLAGTMSFRLPSIPYPPVAEYTRDPFAFGFGGFVMGNNSRIYGNSTHSLYVAGKLDTSQGVQIGTSASPIGTLFANNAACGTGGSYGSSCSPQQPIIGDTFYRTIYANRICATDQINNNGYSNTGPLPGLEVGCSPPLLKLPPYNKAAHAGRMTSTVTDTTCSFSCTKTVAANTKYNGNLHVNGTLLLNGDVYVTGNLTGNGGELKVADGITKRPVIVVNGKIDFTFIVSHPNNMGITPVLISYYSWDTACSNSDSCTTIDPNNVYMSTFDTSSFLTTTTRGGLSHAINVSAAYATGYPTGFEGSLYAYFGAISVNSSTFTGTMAAQQFFTPNSATTIYLTNESWPE